MSSKRKSLPSKVLDSFNSSDTKASPPREFQAEFLGDKPSGDLVPPPSAPHTLLATPADSDNSDYSNSGRDEGFPIGIVSPFRWSDSELPLTTEVSVPSARQNAEERNKPNWREFGSNSDRQGDHTLLTNNGRAMTPPATTTNSTMPPFVNPFFQAQLHEARIQHEHARMLQEVAMRQQNDQNHHHNHHSHHPNNHQLMNHQPPPPFQQVQSSQHQQHPFQHNMQPLPQIPPSMGAVRSPSSMVNPENIYSGCRKSMDDVLKRLASKMNHSSIDDSERLKHER